MARGNHVDGVRLIKKFGLIILTPEFDGDKFDYYNEIYFSKRGTLIGKWGEKSSGAWGKPYMYKDYLCMSLPNGCKLIRRTSGYLFFKIQN